MFSRLPDHQKGIIALIAANIIWGAASPIFKLSLTNIPVFTLAFIRFFGAAIILYPLAFPHIRIARRDWRNLFLISFFGVTVNISFFFLGLTLAPSINAPIIMMASPFFLYLLSITFLHEKPHPRILTGIAVSLVGVVVIVGQPLLVTGFSKELLGNIFFLIAAFGGVGHALFSKKTLERYTAMSITYWSFLIGSITFFPLFVMETLQTDWMATLDMTGIVGIIFGIFFSSAAAYFVFEWGLKKVQAQEAGIFVAIDPVVASILAYFMLGESATPLFLAGSLFVFGGVAIAEWGTGYRHKRLSKPH